VASTSKNVAREAPLLAAGLSENISRFPPRLAAVITRARVISHHAPLIFEAALRTWREQETALLDERKPPQAGDKVALSNGAGNFPTKFSPLLYYIKVVHNAQVRWKLGGASSRSRRRGNPQIN